MKRKRDAGPTLQGNPFAFGFEGEWWSRTAGALIVPIPDTNKAVAIAIIDGMYTVITVQDHREYDSVLMVAAMVQAAIDRETGDEQPS